MLRLSFRQLLPLGCAVSAALLLAQEKSDLGVVNRLKMEEFQDSKVMDDLFYLTDVYGPRLTNSPGYMQAAEWAVKRLKEYGLQNAHLEKWGPFGQSWTYTKFAAHMTAPQYSPLIGFPLAWTPGTNGPVSGEPILAVMTRDANYEKYKGKLKGKIVMIDSPRDVALSAEALSHRYNDTDLTTTAGAPDPGAPLFQRPQAAAAADGGPAARSGSDAPAGGRRAQQAGAVPER